MEAHLDEISAEEANRGLPDITFLVISKQSGLPGQIGSSPPSHRRMTKED
jgi:hypothetical protein